jgi:hypothetical protein
LIDQHLSLDWITQIVKITDRWGFGIGIFIITQDVIELIQLQSL